MGYEVPSEKLLEAMGGNDWSGLIGGRDASVKGGTPLKQITGPLGKPCLVVLPVVPETLRYDRDKGPAAFVDGNQVTLSTFDEDGVALERKGGGISEALRAILGSVPVEKAKKEIHEVTDRKGGDLILQDLVGVDARGKATGLRMIMTELPKTLVIYDGRGRKDAGCSLEDGERSTLRRMRVMLFHYQGLLVTCGNLAGGSETVTIDSVAGVAEAIKRVASIVAGVNVKDANEAQDAYDAESFRIGGERGVTVHLDPRFVLEILGAVLLLAAIFGYSYLQRMENPPAWVSGLLESNSLAIIGAALAITVYALASGMLRDKNDSGKEK